MQKERNARMRCLQRVTFYKLKSQFDLTFSLKIGTLSKPFTLSDNSDKSIIACDYRLQMVAQ